VILYPDTETASTIPLDYGVFKYAEAGRILLTSHCIDDGPSIVEEWGGDSAAIWRERFDKADQIVFHNAEFDVTMFACCGVEVPIEKVYCTMGQARRHGLPGALEKLCDIFKIPQDQAKVKDSKRLIRLFCIPDKDGNFATSETHPLDWAAFKEYARHDPLATRALHRIMPRWNDELERAIWELDQVMNRRGFAVDTELAWWAVELVENDKASLNNLMAQQTEGAVLKGTQGARLLKYLLSEHGVALPDMTASTLERRLKDESLPQTVRDLISIRMQTARASTAKYKRLLECVNVDGRLRGVKVYCGAARTGRWAATKFQSDNMPRPTLPPEEIALGIRAIKTNTVDLIGQHPLSKYAAEGIRGTVVAKPGRKLLVCDLANIEGRVTTWLAGHWDKLDAFRRYDEGTGPDLYKVAYGRAFNVDSSTVAGMNRQIGKVMELMLGYGGAVGAFITGAETYKIELAAMADACWPTIPRRYQLDALAAFARAWVDGQTFDLTETEWSTCFALSRMWRDANQPVKDYWWELEQAAVCAIGDGGVHQAGVLAFDKQNNWLRMRLPSGRYLCYPSPKITQSKFGPQIRFWGVDPYSKKWSLQKTWGGTLLENAAQAISRDILAEGLLAAEAAQLYPVLHVHDEIVCEVPCDSVLTAADLTTCMIGRPDWADELPLAAKAFETERYYKEL
jgi:DNA polymerase bacteriophage-type